MDSLTLQRMCQSFYLILRDTSLTSRSLESSASICTQVCVRVSLPGVQSVKPAGGLGLGLGAADRKSARGRGVGGAGRGCFLLFRFRGSVVFL